MRKDMMSSIAIFAYFCKKAVSIRVPFLYILLIPPKIPPLFVTRR